MPILIVALGFYVVYPLVLILVNSFNVARISEPARYGLDNWFVAFSQPRLLQSLGNTIVVYFMYTTIGFPFAVLIAWALARIRMPFAHGLEFLFWVSFMLPSLRDLLRQMPSTTINSNPFAGAGKDRQRQKAQPFADCKRNLSLSGSHLFKTKGSGGKLVN